MTWGLDVGSTALGVNPLAIWLGQSGSIDLEASLGCFYFANVAWTIIYDTIYAYQDVADDAKAGIKSMAVRHLATTKTLLSGRTIVQISLLLSTGLLASLGLQYFIGTFGAGTSIAAMIWKVDLTKPSECMWWFKNGAWFVGGSIVLGLLGQYMVTLMDLRDDQEQIKKIDEKTQR